MPDKKLSKKIIKDSKKIAQASKKAVRDSKRGRMDAIKKLSKVKGKAEPKKKRNPDTGFRKGATPMIPGQYESKVKRTVKEGIKNSGMRKAAKKKREAAKAAGRTSATTKKAVAMKKTPTNRRKEKKKPSYMKMFKAAPIHKRR
tara:strand:- start:77 stop:508 length:432 start_codon:yes stop_codon:yes gene_type:complete